MTPPRRPSARLRLALLAALLLTAAADGICAEPAAASVAEAMEWCSGRALDRIEGVWNYPDDRVKVLIRRSVLAAGDYEIIAVESDDLALVPGEKIGEVRATADPVCYVMRICTRRKKGRLASPKECTATLTASDDGLQIEAPGRKWRINPLAILPRFWGIVSVRSSQPNKPAPVGMQRIYPSYDGNGSSRFHIRYL